MSFSCSILQGKKDLTSGNNPAISYGLYDLGPSNIGHTDAISKLLSVDAKSITKITGGY